MNTRAETAASMIDSTLIDSADRDSIRLPAGAGLALAALIGSVTWIGIFALLM
ncbi:hypothetical protein [Pararhodobacter oceanensis]|uniref:hypothetical protein n=1 Tax=Pararhodobacter oceanensis TaxID=2172121 RepID=UPI001403C888|nr:hypothetical protein [Pararhodobacter oceanensis]